MFSEMAIKVENLSKCYEIYEQPSARLKQFIVPRLLNLAGLPSKKYYREFWALKDVSFEIKKGETVGIIGRNGGGKSTLLQMICGILSPTSGKITTNGRVAALLELGSGFNPEFTGRENVYMNASVLGLTKEEIDTRFDEIAAFADIGDFIEQQAGQPADQIPEQGRDDAIRQVLGCAFDGGAGDGGAIHRGGVAAHDAGDHAPTLGQAVA